MGGWGSGRGQSGKDTTSDYRALDVRRLQRDGLLAPGRSFGWNWTRDGETVASIQVRAETDRIILNYRHKSGGDTSQGRAECLRQGPAGADPRIPRLVG